MIVRFLSHLRRSALTVRTVLGAFDSYRRYLAHHDSHHSDHPPLTRREFYLRQEMRKWSGISRCC